MAPTPTPDQPRIALVARRTATTSADNRTQDGELLRIASAGSHFVGVQSHQVIDTFTVAEVGTLDEYARAIEVSIRAAFGKIPIDDALAKGIKRDAMRDAKQLTRLVADWPSGTLVVRKGKTFTEVAK